jgi:hypothetical protein
MVLSFSGATLLQFRYAFNELKGWQSPFSRRPQDLFLGLCLPPLNEQAVTQFALWGLQR